MHRVISAAEHRPTQVQDCGSPIVFLHAGVADSRMWQSQIESIRTTHRVIAYDRRGFGATPAADEPYSDVDDLLAVLDEFAADRAAVVVGCSQGGRIAIDAALAAPGRIRALILISPSISGAPALGYPAGAKPVVEALDAAEAARDIDRINELEARLWLDGPLAPPGRVSGILRRLFLDMNGIALRAPQHGSALDPPPAYGRLSEIAIPTLVIWGDLDFPDIHVRCLHLAREVPGSQTHIVAGAAHLPNLERPTEITDLIKGFIGRLGNSQSPAA